MPPHVAPAVICDRSASPELNAVMGYLAGTSIVVMLSPLMMKALKPFESGNGCGAIERFDPWKITVAGAGAAAGAGAGGGAGAGPGAGGVTDSASAPGRAAPGGAPGAAAPGAAAFDFKISLVVLIVMEPAPLSSALIDMVGFAARTSIEVLPLAVGDLRGS